MKNFLFRFVCRFLAVSMIVLPYSAVTQAAMIGSQQAIQASAAAERDKVRGFLARADVQRQLAAFGVTGASATERVSALTDDEVQSLAGRIDALPAGADISATAVLLILLIVIVLLFLLDRRR
jgi:hypothetical protein